MIPAEVSNGNVHLVESATTQVSGTTAALNSTEAQHQICGNCFFFIKIKLKNKFMCFIFHMLIIIKIFFNKNKLF